MRIADVEVFRLEGPLLRQPIRGAFAPGAQIERWRAVLVKVTSDDGLVGWGTPGYGDTSLVESWIKPQLVGQDPFLLERHGRIFQRAGAGWGVEIALWDLIGKATGQPLWKLWGGYRDRVPAYASYLELRTPERKAEDALAARDEGYRALKLRLHEWTMKADLAHVEAVRRALGDGFVILTDANQAQQPGTIHPDDGPVWTYERAVQTARELERLGVYWLEEPLDRYDFDGLKRLCAAVDLPIAGGENNRGMHEFRTMIEQDVYDVLQPEAMVSGTMTTLRKIAALGEVHRKPVAPHHGGGGLGLAAHLHLACAIPNGTYFELLQDPGCMTADEFQWYLAEPLRIDPNGDILAPDRPGLGVEPDPTLLPRSR